MPSIYGAMNIAKMSLITQQIGLEVTGQNIANVNNPNFSKQELKLQAADPVSFGGSPGMIGTGVRPTTVQRRADTFLEGQRIINQSGSGYWDERNNFMSRLEVIFNEAGGYGLNNVNDSFFLGWQQLAFNPQGMTERTDIIGQGNNMSTIYGKMNSDMKNLRLDLDGQVRNSVNEINKLTGEVARLNTVIHEAEANNVHANDFRDQREAAVRKIATYANITTVEDSNKQVMVSLSSGRPLVIGQTAFTLSTKQRADDPYASDVLWADQAGATTDVTSMITGGKIGSWVAMRDTDIQKSIDNLDMLAASFMRDVNAQHSVGYGLDGSTGQDFFTGTNISSTANRKNTGTATIASSIVAPDKVNLHKFEITFTNATTFNITDKTLGSTVATGVAYTSGANIAYFQTQGMNVALTGANATGDKFTVNPSANAAMNLAVHSNIIADSRKIAAAATTDNGNGQNALELAKLQDVDTMNKTTPAATGTATFSEYYNSIVGSVGVDASIALSNYNQQEAVVFELENRHQQVSGVSLDEEMINLIKFQHAYQASARLVSTIDELLQTLVALGR